MDGQVKVVPHSEIQMLGVPLGSDEFVADFVQKKLIGRLGSTVNQLIEFEDLLSLRPLASCASCAPLPYASGGPRLLWYVMLLSPAFLCLTAYAQAALTPTLGGLGLRRAVEHAAGTFAASWHEFKEEAQEQWVRPPEVPETRVSQKQSSFAFDEEMHRHLVSIAPNDREVQRLLRVAQPHAGAFVTAVPSEEDGSYTLTPTQLPCHSAYRLGLADVSCPMCTQTLDKLPKSGDIIFVTTTELPLTVSWNR